MEEAQASEPELPAALRRRIWRARWYQRLRYPLYLAGLLPYLMAGLYYTAGHDSLPLRITGCAMGAGGAWILILAWREKIPHSIALGVATGLVLWGLRFLLYLLTTHPILINA